jgi:hypothetical protein
VLTEDFDFGPQGGGDGKLNTFFGLQIAERYTALWTGTFNAMETGTHTFNGALNDDNASVWLDTNGDGVFQDGERIGNAGCCGSGASGTSDLTAGQSYKFALVVEDTGGGGSIQGRFASPSITDTIINPTSQAGLWTAITRTGGGDIRVDGGAELRMSGISGGAYELNLAGAGAKFTLSGNGASVTEILRTSGANTTLNIGAQASLTANQLQLPSGSTLIKDGLGLATLNGGIGGTQLGNIQVAAGTLRLNGSLSGEVTVAAGATFGGSGTVLNTISGAGAIAPGNSAGILTADAVNPLTGLDVVFEFTKKGAPLLATPNASGNDVLRLTSASPLTASTLNGTNRITIDLQVADIARGDVFQGGFYIDSGDITSSLAGAEFVYLFNGGALPDGITGFDVSMIQNPFDFDGAGPNPAVDGFMMQFVAVPEPTSLPPCSWEQGCLAGSAASAAA